MFNHVCRILFLSVCLAAAPAALADFKCPKMTGINGLKLTAKDNHLSLNNDLAICADLDDPVRIRIQNPKSSDFQVTLGSVTAVQKAGSPYVITGSNADDEDYLEITVEEPDAGVVMGDDDDCGDGTQPDGCAGFDIIVAGLGKLDPKVRVVDNTVTMINAYDTLIEVFEDLGMTLEEVNMLFERFRTETD